MAYEYMADRHRSLGAVDMKMAGFSSSELVEYYMCLGVGILWHLLLSFTNLDNGLFTTIALSTLFVVQLLLVGLVSWKSKIVVIFVSLSMVIRIEPPIRALALYSILVAVGSTVLQIASARAIKYFASWKSR